MVSADSIVPDPTNPQTFNRYSYVLNNPINFTDPSGHRPCELYCPDESINWKEAQFGSAYGGEWDINQQQANSDTASVWIPGAVETVVGLAWEPADWAIALSDGFQWYDGIGMIPLIPATFGDDIGRAVARAIPTGTLDDVVDVFRRVFCSFSADTLVMTEHGPVPISEVELYDKVLAYNEETGEIDYFPVIAVWEHIDPVIVTLTLDGEVIETTPEHPFFTIDGKWLAAGQLQAGDEIRTADWNTGIVEAINFTIDPQPMYNFTVGTAHTYFVGDGQWLVHNACPIGTSFGKIGTLVDDPAIQITQINHHAIQKHGVTAEMLGRWETLNKAVLSQNNGERFLHITSEGAYVLDAASGRAITAYSSTEYTEDLIKIAQQLDILP